MVIHAGVLYYVTIKQIYAARLNPDGTLGTSKLIVKIYPMPDSMSIGLWRLDQVTSFMYPWAARATPVKSGTTSTAPCSDIT